MLTQSRRNHIVPITILSDWWLLLCAPLLVLNIFVYVARKTLLAAYFTAIRLLSTPVLKLLSKYKLVNIPSIVAVNTLLTAILMAVNLPLLHPGSVLLIVSIVVTAMMCIQTAKIAIEFRDGNRTDLILVFTELHNGHGDSGDTPIPTGLQIATLSQGTWLGSIMITLFVVCQFCMLLMTQTGSVEFWLCIHALLLVLLLIDFEMVEHLAAHSRNGVLVKKSNASQMARVLYTLEQVRIFFVWPMYYWAPRRYFLTHTHHHHIENNGPADWQSTLRSLLMPIDTARYLWALGRKRHFYKLLISSVHNLSIILIVFYLEPVFGTLLFCLYLGMAWVFHAFVFAWHGFHDATKPYDVVASNNSTGHYAHHKEPGIHLYSAELREIYTKDSTDNKDEFPVHQSTVAFDAISKHWLLIQCLLWQKKFPVIRKLIKSDCLSDKQLHRLVTGLQLHTRHPTIARLDHKVSVFIGAFLEKCLVLLVSSQHRVLLLSTDYK